MLPAEWPSWNCVWAFFQAVGRTQAHWTRQCAVAVKQHANPHQKYNLIKRVIYCIPSPMTPRKSSTTRFLFLFLAVFAPPLALAALLGWQLSSMPDMSHVVARFPLVEAAIYTGVKGYTLPPRVVETMRTRASEVQAVAASKPRLELNQEYRALERLMIFRHAETIAQISMGLAASALGVGVCGLLFLSLAGRRSLRSREELYRWFSRGRRLLPLFMIGASLPLVLAMIGAAAVEMLSQFALEYAPPGVFVTLVLFALVIIGFVLLRNILRFLRSIFAFAPDGFSGTELGRNNAPEVWALVEDVARRGAMPMPDKILMGFTDGFYVAARAEEPGTPIILHLSVPLLLVLEKGELRAIIGHELAHIREGDLEYRLRFSSAYAAACHAAATLTTDMEEGVFERYALGAARLFAEFFLDTFHGADMHWSRIREAAADSVGAKISTARDAALSLTRSTIYGPAMFAFTASVRQRGGHVEGGVLNGLLSLLATLEIPSLAALLQEEQPHPFDSHPCLEERLRNLDVAGDGALETEARSIRPGALLRELGL